MAEENSVALPRTVAWLGYGGLIPFLALAPASLLDHHHGALWSDALVAYGASARLPGGVAGAVAGLALALQIAAAVFVGITGFRGGKLTYEHGANVRVGGVLVKNPGAGREERAPRQQQAPSPGESVLK